MDEREVNLLLLGIACGALGAANRVHAGVSADVIEAEARELLDRVEGMMRKSGIDGQERFNKIQTMLITLGSAR